MLFFAIIMALEFEEDVAATEDLHECFDLRETDLTP
jgi:hypothetical protein